MDRVLRGGTPRAGRASHPIVLHVDDDRTILELTRGMLQRSGLMVASESDPTVVPKRLVETPVDVVVSDYEMPAMDGGALFERVRSAHPDLPFVLFTGKDREKLQVDPETRARARYVQKQGVGGFETLSQAIWDLVEPEREELLSSKE